MLREALSGALLLVLLATALFLAPDRPGPGPLALVVSVACVHAALLAPTIVRGRVVWGLLPSLLAVPAVCAAAYGHPGAWPLAGSLLLVLLASCAGAAGRAVDARLYLGTMLLVFALPHALRYLALEFGAAASADRWLLGSPFHAAQRVAGSGALPAACVLLLLAWPVWAIARRRT